MSDMSSSNSRPLVVGLTGGIGCGKTTVLECFREMGVPCFMADRQGAACYEDATFRAEVRSLFGEGVFLPNGEVDKKALAQIVFADKPKLEQLNALVHPRVRRAFHEWLGRQTAPFVIYECAILYEYGLDQDVDKVICVYLEKEERLRRLEVRDRLSREALETRMRNQLSAEAKMDRADYVILNYEGNPRMRQCRHVAEQIGAELEQIKKN